MIRALHEAGAWFVVLANAAVGLWALAAHRSQGGLAILSVHGSFALAGAETIDLAGFAAGTDAVTGAPAALS